MHSQTATNLFLGLFFCVNQLRVCNAAAYDMPLKQCPVLQDGSLQVADPNWINHQPYGYEHHFPAFGSTTEMDTDYQAVAHLRSPYRSVIPYDYSRSMGVWRWYLHINKGFRIPIELLRVSSSKCSCIARLREFEEFTSATFLGDRHVVLTTNFSYTRLPGEPELGTDVTRSGKILLVDVEHFGSWTSCGESGTWCDVSKPQVVQLFPSANLASSSSSNIPSIYGCHADSYASETLAGFAATMQPFYMVCMYRDDTSKFWLNSFVVNIHTSDLSSVFLTDLNQYDINKHSTNPVQISNNARDEDIYTFPVHVVGKRLVLYRCFLAHGTDHFAHWCWRNFDYNAWGLEKPALTTALIERPVLVKGMFIGWSGTGSTMLANSTRLYFLDRNSRRLYTLAVDDELNTVFTDQITGIIQETQFRQPMHFDLTPPGPVYFHGEVHHYYEFQRFLQTYRSIDEILLLSGGPDMYRQVSYYK